MTLRRSSADGTFVGTIYQGAKEIGDAHQVLFDSFLRGARLFMDGQWRVAAIQKTKRQSLMEAISFTFQPATRPKAHN